MNSLVCNGGCGLRTYLMPFAARGRPSACDSMDFRTELASFCVCTHLFTTYCLCAILDARVDPHVVCSDPEERSSQGQCHWLNLLWSGLQHPRNFGRGIHRKRWNWTQAAPGPIPPHLQGITLLPLIVPMHLQLVQIIWSDCSKAVGVASACLCSQCLYPTAWWCTMAACEHFIQRLSKRSACHAVPCTMLCTAFHQRDCIGRKFCR